MLIPGFAFSINTILLDRLRGNGPCAQAADMKY